MKQMISSFKTEKDLKQFNTNCNPEKWLVSDLKTNFSGLLVVSAQAIKLEVS